MKIPDRTIIWTHLFELCFWIEELHINSASKIDQPQRWHIRVGVRTESKRPIVIGGIFSYKNVHWFIVDAYIFINKKLSGLMSPWMILQVCKWWTMFKIWLVKCITRLSCITWTREFKLEIDVLFDLNAIWLTLKYLGSWLTDTVIDIEQRSELWEFGYKNTGIRCNNCWRDVHEPE